MHPARILHPVDLSDAAKAALSQALAFARWHEADIQCVTVKSRHSTIAEFALREFVEAVNVDGVRFGTAVLRGEPVSAVAEYARLSRPDLLVVAGSGRPRGILSRAGAFAHELARASRCPTLMVPERHHAPATFGVGSFRHILCATDGSPAASAGLSHALVLAQQSGGRLSVLRVLDGLSNEASCASALFDSIPADARNWCDVRVHVVSGVPFRAILSAIEETAPDVVVLGMRTSHGSTIFMRSTAGAVMRGAGCQVLLIPTDVERVKRRTRVTSADRHLLSIPAPALSAGRAGSH